jgi:hypothetical protein
VAGEFSDGVLGAADDLRVQLAQAAVDFQKFGAARVVVAHQLIRAGQAAKALDVGRGTGQCRGLVDDEARQAPTFGEQGLEIVKQFCVGQLLAAFGQDFLVSHEGGHRHDAVKCPLLAEPHLGWVVDMLLLELEGAAVLDVVADVLFVGQQLGNRALGSGAVQVGVNGLVVEALDDLSNGQVVFHQPAVDLVDGGHFKVGARHQDETIGLQALMLAALEFAFDGTGLVDQHPAQAEVGGVALTKSQFDQSALAGEDLG